MHIRTLTVSAAALIVSCSTSFAQETMADGLVAVNVAGSIVRLPVALAAEACGMDAATVIAASDMMNTDAKGADMVAAEPNTDAAVADPSVEATTEAAVGTGAASTETEAGMATETSTDTASAGASTDTMANTTTDMAAPNASAATNTTAGTETVTSTGDADTSTSAAGENFQVPEGASAGVAADLAMEAEIANGGSEAAAEGDVTAAGDSGGEGAAGGELAMTGASGGEANPAAVCEIDQATADQYGIAAAGETAGG